MAKRLQIFGNLFNGFVKKVNGVGPDKDGNVEIETGSKNDKVIVNITVSGNLPNLTFVTDKSYNQIIEELNGRDFDFENVQFFVGYDKGTIYIPYNIKYMSGRFIISFIYDISSTYNTTNSYASLSIRYGNVHFVGNNLSSTCKTSRAQFNGNGTYTITYESE